MGRVALEISKRIVPGVNSIWLHLRIKDIEGIFGSKENFLSYIDKEFPLDINEISKPLIKSGVLLTNDVSSAVNTITLLIVGKSYIEKFDNLKIYKNSPLT
jgi:hypothetical protein